MALVVSKTRSTTVLLRYVERKRDGSFQYRRRIPADLQCVYSGKQFFVRSLKKDQSKLMRLAEAITLKLDRSWDSFRANGKLNENELNGDADLCAYMDISPERDPSVDQKSKFGVISISDALKLYLQMHTDGSNPKFISDNSRTISSLIDRIGDLSLNSYSRSHAEEYRDHLLRQQSSGTVRRRLRMVCAIINRSIKEKQLQILNPFEGLGIAGEGEDGTKRIPFDGQELRIIAGACRNLDDDIRHIIALQLDTGCRVAEVVGMRVEDVVLSHSVPHVRIRPWGKVRTLKTAASERDIPLVGNALWAAERALETRRKAAEASPWLFPRYASEKEIKATHASNTLNKWLRSLDGVSRDKTTHCFRHAMRDRLRAAQVPFEIQECLGGWGTRTIGQGYGNGYPIAVLAEHMNKLVDPAVRSSE